MVVNSAWQESGPRSKTLFSMCLRKILMWCCGSLCQLYHMHLDYIWNTSWQDGVQGGGWRHTCLSPRFKPRPHMVCQGWPWHWNHRTNGERTMKPWLLQGKSRLQQLHRALSSREGFAAREEPWGRQCNICRLFSFSSFQIYCAE